MSEHTQPEHTDGPIPDCEFTGHNLGPDNCCHHCGHRFIAVRNVVSPEAVQLALGAYTGRPSTGDELALVDMLNALAAVTAIDRQLVDV